MGRLAFLFLVAVPALSRAQLPERPENCLPFPTFVQGVRKESEEPDSYKAAKPIRIKSLRFMSDQPLPAVSKQIASQIKTKAAIQDGPDWPLELQDLARDAWQQHGYFKVQIDFPDVDILQDTEHEQVVRVIIKIEPGRLYRTAGITFSNNIQFDSFQLRALFPLRKGEVFDTHKVTEGIEAARAAYGERGFINVAFLPSHRIDERRNLVSLKIDIEEAQEFRVGKFRILGLEPGLAPKLIENSGFAPGGIFNSNWAKQFLERNKTLLPPDVTLDPNMERRIDEKSGVVDLVVDFRRCPDGNN